MPRLAREDNVRLGLFNLFQFQSVFVALSFRLRMPGSSFHHEKTLAPSRTMIFQCREDQ